LVTIHRARNGAASAALFFRRYNFHVSWTLYLLECVDGSLYAGITNDLERRFEMHLAGKGAKYTRARKPLRILARQDFPDRAAASVAEYRLKRLDVAGKRAFCREHPYPG
jgi:putative endonuclease